MSEMIERIARKLEPQAWAALGIKDTLAYKNRRKSSLRKAKLAIEEMREPTEGMREASRYYLGVGFNVDPQYQAMIDAALPRSP